MTVEELLPHLDAVRRQARGWMARCPAHEDRNPSLSLCEGERGILVRCWAGCSVLDITAALGLTVADLFFESCHGRRRHQDAPHAAKRFDWRRYAGELEDEALGLWLRGKAVLDSARGLDISTWTDEDIDAGLEAIACACTDLACADALEALAFNIRAGGLEKERYASRRAAA